MICCENLIHPFQFDGGVSQRQRVIEDLLAPAAPIDGRRMADLLDYIARLSRHVNFYERNMAVSDWQRFFSGSKPFLLAKIIRYDKAATEKKFRKYEELFRKKPNRQSLQLIIRLIFFQTIAPLNRWHGQLEGSELPAELLIAKLIRDKLQEPVKKFICLANTAVRKYKITKIDFGKLRENDVWELGNEDLISENCFVSNAPTKRKRLIALEKEIAGLFPGFLNAITLSAPGAELSMEQSLVPVKEEFREQHSPHLALFFSFLKLFRYFQDDLNGYTRKHLDFFYKDVLKMVPRPAVADKAHVLFEIQNQLDKYLLKKATRVKNGKDRNKAEINFALSDELVVNKTKVTDLRTLFLNHETVFDSGSGTDKRYVEGVYIAPDATKADGVSLPFGDDVPANWPTLGAKWSKYTNPESKFIKPYPPARLGFVLSSPVLFLQEGKRTIDIRLACQLRQDLCASMRPVVENTDPCCEGAHVVKKQIVPDHCTNITEDLFLGQQLLDELTDKLNREFYYISQELIARAVTMGAGKDVVERLRKFLLEPDPPENKQLCYCPPVKYRYDTCVPASDFEDSSSSGHGFSEEELESIKELFTAFKPLRVSFSGEKEWIQPEARKVPPELEFTLTSIGGGGFRIDIKAIIGPDKPAITFYDQDKLGEDLGTTQPLVKVELDDRIRWSLEQDLATELPELIHKDGSGDDCCLTTDAQGKEHLISLYHFFRNVVLEEHGTNKTSIHVTVCGLKKFVVQHDDTVMDVNGPVYPWGPRPEIIDFDVVTASKSYCINSKLINDVQGVINPINIPFLNNKIAATGHFKIGTTEKQLDDFLTLLPFPGDAALLKAWIADETRNYCDKNLIGPNFYVGSEEVFGKKWTDVFINLNWKDKPVDFNEHYLAYWADPTLPPLTPPPGFTQKYGLDKDQFEISLSLLQDGKWKSELEHPLPLPGPPPPPVPADTAKLNTKTNCVNRMLFPDANLVSFCQLPNPFEQTLHLRNSFFDQLDSKFNLGKTPLTKYDGTVRDWFLKVNLQNQDFLHKDYAFVLARQMMALGKYPDSLLEGAVYRDVGNGSVIVFSNLINIVSLLKGDIDNAKTAANTAKSAAELLYNQFNIDADYQPPPAPVPPASVPTPTPPLNSGINNNERNHLFYMVYNAFAGALGTVDSTQSVEDQYKNLEAIYSFVNVITGEPKLKPLSIPIPNEPWTPVINEISIDYKAYAEITDIDLIHLYPYADTYKAEDIESTPTLFPTFCDEGTLFIGLKDLEPGSNLSVLFQLAEATADSEADQENLTWYYLDNNQWKELRKGFEVLSDATHSLTTSGIIKFAMPANMTRENTILSKGVHWIRVSIPQSSRSVAEVIAIHTQAVLSEFTNEEANDKSRLLDPLPAGALAKLTEADPLVKTVTQPYDSFGGRAPEAEGHFYQRVSELLRHKNRAVQKWDYERIVLEAFPQVYKTKCINHSYALDAKKFKIDFPVAPGYVLLAVIPDLGKLKAGNSFEPKAPLSLLDEIEKYLRKKTSPFVRLRAMNPRYEKVDFCLKVKLIKGKDEHFYKEKLQEDLRLFMAPWAIGEYSRLRFGQCINRSDILQFLEGLDYVDYILSLAMRHERETVMNSSVQEICPRTPRSVLLAGGVDICIRQDDCETWQPCYADREGKKVRVDCCTNPTELVHDFCRPGRPVS